MKLSAWFALSVLSASSLGQVPEAGRPVQGGDLLLQQTWARLTPEDDSPGRVSLTIEARTWSEAEMAVIGRPMARWQPSQAVWTMFETTHPLQFEVGRPNSALRKRALLSAGRYVLSIQNDEGSSQFVFTRASVVEQRVRDPRRMDDLALLGGHVIPVDRYETDFRIARPRARLTADLEGRSVGLEIQLADRSWDVEFVVWPRPTEETDAGAGERRRLQGHLSRLEVPRPLIGALVARPRRVEIFTLDPRSHEKPSGGKPTFHAYHVLGSRSLDCADASQRSSALRLQELLRAAVLAHPDGTVEDCFEPRHALRLHMAKGTIDLVICFACSQVAAWVDGKPLEDGLLIKRFQEPAFSKLCRELGLPIAP